VNKKGNVPFLMSTLVVVVLVGLMLFVFHDPIDEFRVDLLNDSATQDDSLLLIVLYGLFPIMWFFYILLSIFAVKIAVDVAGQGGGL
jgi:hypothetical protein